MKVVVAGGTGFIGRGLCRSLLRDGHRVVVLSRSAGRATSVFGDSVEAIEWPDGGGGDWRRALENADAVVNLAGENIGAGRWDEAHKARILQSRVGAAEAIVRAVAESAHRPRVVVQGSAVGYYGNRGDEEIDESSGAGSGFLADVIVRVEGAAREVRGHGVRSVLARTGVVLGEGGMLRRMIPPFRAFAGGPLGNGRQWVSWVHAEDEVNAIRFLLEGDDLEGPFNLTAPAPVRMGEFCRALGRALGRPSWLRTPAFVLRLLFGEMADEVLLSGAKVMPARLLGAGFRFRFADVGSAIGDVLPAFSVDARVSLC